MKKAITARNAKLASCFEKYLYRPRTRIAPIKPNNTNSNVGSCKPVTVITILDSTKNEGH